MFKLVRGRIDSSHLFSLIDFYVPQRSLRIISKSISTKIVKNDLDYRSIITRTALAMNEVYNEIHIFSNHCFHFT